MFNKFVLKKIGIIVLVSFSFLIFSSQYSFAKDEDVLLKARKYYQQGNYDESVKILQKFIENLRAIVEQKKNVAEAFYLLSKVYFTVGEDAEVDKNLKKVYETFPSFYKEEKDLEFLKKVNKIRTQMGLKEVKNLPAQSVKIEKKQPTKRVVEKIGKKKKKFPILLVVGGVVVLAAVAYFLLKKKKEVYDIRGEWAVHEDIPADGVIFEEPITDDLVLNFTGDLVKGTFRDSYGDKGVYTVQDKTVTIRYTDLDPRITIKLLGSFKSTVNMSGDIIIDIPSLNVSAKGTWGANKKGQVKTLKKHSKTHSRLVEYLLSK